MKALIVVMMLAALTGCAEMGAKIAIEQRQAIASGLIGCPPKEIAITHTGLATFEATCKGKLFYCTEANGGKCTAQMTGG